MDYSQPYALLVLRYCSATVTTALTASVVFLCGTIVISHTLKTPVPTGEVTIFAFGSPAIALDVGLDLARRHHLQGTTSQWIITYSTKKALVAFVGLTLLRTMRFLSRWIASTDLTAQ